MKSENHAKFHYTGCRIFQKDSQLHSRKWSSFWDYQQYIKALILLSFGKCLSRENHLFKMSFRIKKMN
jgi:hypothetical protein